MRADCIALAVVIFLAVSQCQEYNNIESPLSIALILNDTECDESVQFASGIFEAAKLETFEIDVKNSGNDLIRDLEVYALIPRGMKYIDSSYLGGGYLDASLDPSEFDETQDTKIKWVIGDLEANDAKSILIRTYIKCQVKEAKIELAAFGNKPDRSVQATIDASIDLGICNCTSSLARTPLIINAILDDTKCGNWTTFSPRKMEAAKLETFRVDIQNTGENPISNLIVLALIPKGIKYESSSYSETADGDLETILEPQEFNEAQNTKIEWIVRSLQAKESRSIFLNLYLKCPINRTNIEFVAIGNVAGRSVNATTKQSFDLGNCDCIGGNIDIDLQVCEVNNNTTADFGKGCLEKAKLDLYNISVMNNGDVTLNNVKVIAEMAKGMMYVNSSYSYAWKGKLNITKNPDDFSEDIKTKLVWNIRDLLPRESKSIILVALLNENVTDRDIFAMVQGYSPYSSENEPIIDFAKTASDVNEYRSASGGPCSDEQVSMGLCKKQCPSWARDFNLTMLMQSQEFGGEENNFTMKVCKPLNDADIAATCANCSSICDCCNTSANNTTITSSLGYI